MHPLSIAPMMDRTDRHFRALMRTITRRTLLYTEMVTTGAVLRGPRARLLAYSPAEHPIALQLGGDEPQQLAECARIAEDLGFDEVNLNVGCPSDRVQSGQFGACLMLRPERVAESVAAMRGAARLPVTVKHRIGVDEVDRYEDMLRFVDIVAAAGCARFSVHARKAWLSGLSPAQNREIPPLRYEEVYRLKAERPTLRVEINGGVRDLDAAEALLRRVDAVMIGRAAWDTPMLFAEADRRFYGANSSPSLSDVLAEILPYALDRVREGESPSMVTRGWAGLLVGVPGAGAWRRGLAGLGPLRGEAAAEALQTLVERTLRGRPAA